MARAASQDADYPCLIGAFGAQSVIDGKPPCPTALRRAQRSASSISAMLSGPPETATAISGRASNPPIAARLAAELR